MNKIVNKGLAQIVNHLLLLYQEHSHVGHLLSISEQSSAIHPVVISFSKRLPIPIP